LYCRVELQETKNTNPPLTTKFSELDDESKEPTYDVVEGAQPVNMTPNPAYSTTDSGTQIVKITPNPAYGTSSIVSNTEEPAYM